MQETRPPAAPAPATTLFGQPVDARALVRTCPTVHQRYTCNQIVRIFHDDPSLNCMAVLDDEQRIVGVLRSLNILRRGTEGFFHELTGRRSCTQIMDPDPLVFDASVPLLTMSAAVGALDDRHLVDGFFVTEHGKYLGAGRMTDLIRAVSEHHIAVARYANPLTMLPGNVPIDQHIQRSLAAQQHFVVGYFDLDNFKAYNDVYGYSAGDAVIQLAASVLRAQTDEMLDFLGHVGGDDFVAVFSSTDWERRTQQALHQFDREVLRHVRSEHIEAGGLLTNNRQGVEVFHSLVSLSAGIVRIAPGDYALSSEISSRLVEAKKQAKRSPGSSYFVDRRAARTIG
jgi:diguanylate cyclase (GGDEF)-like protein